MRKRAKNILMKKAYLRTSVGRFFIRDITGMWHIPVQAITEWNDVLPIGNMRYCDSFTLYLP